MAVEVHPLMQNSYDLDGVSAPSVEEHVGSSRELEIARPYIVARATSARVSGYGLYGPFNLPDVHLGLLGAPSLFSESPDRFQIRPSSGR